MNAVDRNRGVYIAELFSKVFGYGVPVYVPWGKGADWTADGYKGVETRDREAATLLSGLGTPVLGSFTLKGGSYQTFDLSGQLKAVSIADFVMPYATLVEFSRSMNMTQTRILGNSGTVKEVYGLDDWRVSIRGFCLTDEGRTAQRTTAEQVAALVAWRNVADSVQVEGDMFLDKNITNLAIESLSVRDIQGKADVVSFEIQALSDEAIELLDIL